MFGLVGVSVPGTRTLKFGGKGDKCAIHITEESRADLDQPKLPLQIDTCQKHSDRDGQL